jgi:hypothetical protein
MAQPAESAAVLNRLSAFESSIRSIRRFQSTGGGIVDFVDGEVKSDMALPPNYQIHVRCVQ